MGADFQRGDVSEPLFEWLKLFLSHHPETLALLEFTSPGRNRRQVDCALIGPGGVDLIEVKNKRGVVRGSADGDWSVEDQTGTFVFSNTKAGRPENPYQQASHTADDLARGLHRITRSPVRVTPLVLVPAPDPRSTVEPRHSRVGLALNISDLRRQLRSANSTSGGGWNGFDSRELPTVLGLRPFDLAFVQGRIVSARTHAGVPDVSVTLHRGDHEESFSVQTNPFGRYTFSSRLNQPLHLDLEVPQQYLQPDPFAVNPAGRFVGMPDLKLQDRFSVDELRIAYQQQEQQLQRQFTQRLSVLGEQRLQEHAQLGLLLDELTAELRRAQLRIAGLEQDAHGQTTSRLALPVQGASHSDSRQPSGQGLQIARTLEHLSSGPVEARRAAMEPALKLLALLTLAGSHARPAAQARGLALEYRPELSPRAPVTLPADHQGWEEKNPADVIDIDSFVVSEEPPDTEPPVTVAGEAKKSRPMGQVWLLTGMAGLALLGGGLLAWNRQSSVQDGPLTSPRQAAQEQATHLPETALDAAPIPPEPTPGAERLPGVAADAPLPSAGDALLPGVPVTP